MSTEQRRLDVLRAIVSDYVSTREPVGSKMLADRWELGVSPATIRNDMAALEDQGYIYQPHTSAGRIPTMAGYRLFVDRLAQVKPMSTPERRAIEAFLAEATDFDEVVDRTVRLLAQLTRQVAVVQYPRRPRTRVARIELVDLGQQRVLIILITDDGHITQRVFVSPTHEDAPITVLRDTLNELTAGAALTQLPQLLEAFFKQPHPLATSICAQLLEMSKSEDEERIVMAGTANLARSGLDFARTIGPVLDALEEQVALLRLFAASSEDVTVSIGEENDHQGLTETSVVSGTYGDREANAHLAVVGPVRMDYPTAIGAVRALGAYLTHFLHEQP